MSAPPVPTVTARLLVSALAGSARWILLVGAASAVAAGALGFLLPNKYASLATFVPEVRQSARLGGNLGNLTGLVSQLGLNLGGQLGGEGGNESPEFYAELAYSREVMTRVLYLDVPNYRADDPGADSIPLIDLLKVRGSPEAKRIEKGILKLKAMLTVAANTQTDVITLRVTARWPGLARDIAAGYIRIINDFNLRRRSNRASVRREFIEERARAAAADLRAWEDSLRRFQMQNRQTMNSPNLLADERAIERQITISQEVYLVVRRELETTRIDEGNYTPVITVIDRPSLPGRKMSPRRAMIAIFAGVLGALGAAAAVLLRATGADRTLAAAFRPVPPGAVPAPR